MSTAEPQQPPIPQPRAESLGNDPIARAIAAIQNYTEILGGLGNRFGYISWRDRFQREGGPLLGQLFQRLADRQRRSQQSSLGDWVTEMNTNDVSNTNWQPSDAVHPLNYPLASMYETSVSQTGPLLSGINWQSANSLGLADYSNISPGSSSVQLATSGPQSNNNFELGGWTTMETLPGGYLNARFS